MRGSGVLFQWDEDSCDLAQLRRHRIAKLEDSEILGELNHQLIKDEGHRNSMSIPELAERMRGWLINDHRASVFENDSGILAYALYREDKDLLYLRQFFVQRRKRRSGIAPPMHEGFTVIQPLVADLSRLENQI